ncbi:MAG: cbb3-type cytochrome oxidase assembly protein CcoS [Planctomycetota bacterium]
MTIILMMLPLALLLGALFVFLFVRAVQTGQFDELDTPAIRAIFDDDTPAGE